MRCSLIVIIFLCCASSHAQIIYSSGSPISNGSPLSIGDSVPAHILHYIQQQTHNEQQKSRDGLIILDFWGTNCTACIKAFPKLDSLQQQFASQAQIVLVNKADSEDKIQALFQRFKSKNGQPYQFALINRDTILKSVFPHQTIPHYVWLHKGRVAAITASQEVTAANIAALLAGKSPQLTLKRDLFDFNIKLPLLYAGNGGADSAAAFRSVFAGYLPGISTRQGMVSQGTHKKYYFINRPVLDIYQALLRFAANRIVLETNDAYRYSYNASMPDNEVQQWLEANSYSYEFTVPQSCPDSTARAFMVQDIDRYLGLHGRLEQRLVNCLVLQCMDGANTLITRGGKSSIRTNDTVWQCRNKPFSALVSTLNYHDAPAPGAPVFIDETGITASVDMELPVAAFTDTTLLKKQLAQYGIALVPALRKIEVFVLSQNQKIAKGKH